MKKFSNWGFGCLILGALPFAGGGALAGYQVGHTIWAWAQVQSWVERPARILQAELVSHPGDDSTTFSVEASYEYSFGSETYRAERVTLSQGSDNIGTFHHDVYAELASHLESGRPFRCYVNPDDPAQAILYPVLRWGELGLLSVFALLFGGVGVVLIGLAIYGWRTSGEGGKLQELHPGRPWLWKKEWRQRRISAASRPKMIFIWVFAAFWNLISLPLLFFVPEEIGKGNHAALIALVFPAVGMGLLAWAVRLLLQWRKFGNSVFELATLPGVTGGILEGRLLSGVKSPPEKGFELSLSCLRKRTTGSGDSRSTSTRTLWQDVRTVRAERIGYQEGGCCAPVRFAIPPDAPPTDESDSDDQVLWRLEASASLPGVDYAASFEVPVFTTPDSDPDFVAESLQEDSGNAYEPNALENAGIRTELLPDGKRFVFGAARSKGAALALTGFFIIWTGAVWLLFTVGAPLLFPILFGAVDLLLFFGVLEMWFAVRRVEVSAAGLTFSGGLFGLGRPRSIAAQEIAELKPAQGMQGGSRLFYQIHLRSRAGKNYIIATQIPNRHLARVLVEEMQRPWKSGAQPATGADAL